MLSQLTIHNFALVDQLDLELESGTTAITGETGAGKSIMLDALGLTLGDRADLDVIRTGAERADICASFTLQDNPEAAQWLDDNDLPAEDGLCILRRVLTRDGRSRAYINGQSTTLAQLKVLGEMLIDIHSQHEHQSLLQTATHQKLLDAFGGNQELALNVKTIATNIRSLKQEIQKIQKASAEGNAQRELLSYQVQELEELRLQPGEFSDLEIEHQQLTHADSALSAIGVLSDLCSDNDEFNIEQGLRRANVLLGDIPFSNPLIDEALNLFSSALIQVEEAASTLKRASDKIELNPERLVEVDERLGSMHKLARKHKVDPDSLYEHTQTLIEQVANLNSADSRVEAMGVELTELEKSYSKEATKLSQARGKAAGKLEKEINAQLSKLGMSAAKFSIALNTSKDAAVSLLGFDAAEFLISTNPGNPAKPMVRIASGGELSRISLAIQVVIAQTSAIPTLVFDEVDVGIGGGTAKAVGELLRELGKRGQVLCVTHQPQVASQAHQHLLVSKSSDSKATATTLQLLKKAGRVTEIARMLGGDDLSNKSLAHAKELLATIN